MLLFDRLSDMDPSQRNRHDSTLENFLATLLIMYHVSYVQEKLQEKESDGIG